MSALRVGLVVALLGMTSAGGRAEASPGTCSKPRVDPKTGDVTAESAVADHDKGCTPAGGPKPDVPTQPTPAPEPEKPSVAANPSQRPHRDQPMCPDKPAANDTASTSRACPGEAALPKGSAGLSTDKKPSADKDKAQS
jgi:hypothetical protein